MALALVSDNKCFGGRQKVFSHESTELGCKMNFGVYLPPQALEKDAQLPVLYFLSGLTCTEANFIQKSGFQKYAAEHGLIVVNPDTSPRGCKIEGEEDSWDFGSGAGFYLDATEAKWSKNYRMFSYVTKELPSIVEAILPVDPKLRAISGHSMGGHGALICALKNPGFYKSVSAFAPIANPSQCPWGKKAFEGYLGSDQDKWMEYDACSLVKCYSGPELHILIDQGAVDEFLAKGQLLPDNFITASTPTGVQCEFRMQEGYDHSYFFISTFIGDHFAHHAKHLKAKND
jgi:S-formylglutathione hydrolase